VPSSPARRLALLCLFLLALCAPGLAVRPAPLAAGSPFVADAPSRTGPTPPPEVLARDLAKAAEQAADLLGAATLPVPAYYWRHGCGPTALGMVIGYYDGQGYPDLILGSAATQTYQVNQAIASGGDSFAPFAPGNERHYEDYARPQDYAPLMRLDDYLAAGRIPHANDSIADWMYTSRSTHANYYGWSWSNHVGPAFVSYVDQRNPAYAPSYQLWYMGYGLSWSILTGEIDAGRPMVFLVDTDANGGTDHFVTVIGYRTSPRLQYASLDTWYATVRWENFEAIAGGVPWGIWGGWAFSLTPPPRYTLEIAISGSGAVTRAPDEPTYAPGTPVALTAIPAPGWAFGGWGGDASGSANPLTLTMTSDKRLTALFYDPTTLRPRAWLPGINGAR